MYTMARHAAGMAILRDRPTYFLLNSHFDLEPDYIIRKPMKQIPTIYRPYGNIVNFSHTSQIHFLTNYTSFRPFKRMGVQMPNNRG